MKALPLIIGIGIGVLVFLAAFVPALLLTSEGDGTFLLRTRPGGPCIGVDNCQGGNGRDPGTCSVVVTQFCTREAEWTFDPLHGLVNIATGTSLHPDSGGKALTVPLGGATTPNGRPQAPTSLHFMADSENRGGYHLWYPQVASGGPAIGKSHTGAFLTPIGDKEVLWASAPSREDNHGEASALYADFSLQEIPQGEVPRPVDPTYQTDPMEGGAQFAFIGLSNSGAVA